jgi:hypothetical protein
MRRRSPVNGIRSGSKRNSNRLKLTTPTGGENGTQSAGCGRAGGRRSLQSTPNRAVISVRRLAIRI